LSEEYSTYGFWNNPEDDWYDGHADELPNRYEPHAETCKCAECESERGFEKLRELREKNEKVKCL